MNKGQMHQRLGYEAESVVVARLIELGYDVSIPAFAQLKYDIIVDDCGELHKAQIKSAYETDVDKIDVGLRTSMYNSKGECRNKEYQNKDIDCYIIYDKQRNNVLWVDFEDAPSTTMTFTYKNKSEYNSHNVKRANFAKDYEVGPSGSR